MARGAAALAAGVLMVGFAVPSASADQVRDQQWALTSLEAETKVWTVSQGDGVIVAVIDTGVNQDHQDLTGQVLPGADFSGGNTDGRVDKDGHGTAMASLIAGHGHGAQTGVMGLAPKAKILPVRVTTDGDSPSPSASQNPDPSQGADSPKNELADAIRFAADHGARVVNISLSGVSRFDTQLRKAISYAVSKDVVLVSGTGNNGTSLGGGVDYPAAFPGVVAVGAVDSKGAVWDRSTPGSETTLVAPGVGIYHASAKSPTSYASGSGTSDSTAYVSATAALIRSKYPNLSAGQVINRMIKSATPPPDGTVVPNNRYGYGVLAPAKALEANPVVDSGPLTNPLVKRPETKGTPPTDDESDATDEPTAEPPVPAAGGGGGGDTGLVIGAVVAGAVVVGLSVVAVVQGRRRRRAAAAGGYRQPPYGGTYQ